jgi:hypothetical protein
MSNQVICASYHPILLISLLYIVEYAGTMWDDIMSATMMLLFAITVLMTFYEGCYALALYFGFPNE